MNKFLLLLILVISACIPTFAQKEKSPQEMRREIHEFKLKYLAQEMDLKEDQQKKFFDLYNQMTEERVKVFKETRALEKKLAESDQATDAEYEAVTRSITAAKEKDAAIEKKYDEKFATFLSAKQIYKMKEAEQKFRKKIHEMHHKKRKK